MTSANHFSPRKGQPPYWLRDDPSDIEEHRRMIRRYEEAHRSPPPAKEEAT